MTSDNPEKQKLLPGTWDRLPSKKIEKQKLDFPINIAQVITFPPDFKKPIEMSDENDEDSVYYKFDVLHENEEKFFFKSAETFLAQIKSFEPLAGKTFKVTRKIAKNGHQFYDVEEIKG